MHYAGQEQADSLTLLLYPFEGGGQATLYEDAGDGYEQINRAAQLTILRKIEAGTIRVLIGMREGTFVLAHQRLQEEPLRSALASLLAQLLVVAQ